MSISVAAEPEDYTTNALVQHNTSCGVGALTYDANGNLATGGGWTYTHNGSSRLVGVSGPATASFGRDGRNRDVKRTINGTTTYLIYDGWNLVAEYDAAGVLTTRYIHGPQVDEILAKVTTTSTTFPLPDALGSTIAVTDASGAVVERVYYSDAFGTPTFKDASGTTLAGSSTGTRFLFTGREWLAALGLCDYRNRTYSAELGRFIETDPIGFEAGDVNLYRYVVNNPLNAIDQFGLECSITIIRQAGIIGHQSISRPGGSKGFAGVTRFLPIDIGEWDNDTKQNQEWKDNGDYYEWETTKKTKGSISAGSAKGKCCKDASCSDINSCIDANSKSGLSSTPYTLVSQCRTVSENVISKCCLSKGNLIHSPE